ncbi:hypothetical protein ACW0US_17800 [Xanthomonas euvesicatoria]
MNSVDVDALEPYLEARDHSMTALELDAPDRGLVSRLISACEAEGQEDRLLDELGYEPGHDTAYNRADLVYAAAAEFGSIRLVEIVRSLVDECRLRP